VGRYPEVRLYEEAAFLAYYLHWSHGEIFGLPHRERVRFCRETSRINALANDDKKKEKSIFDIT